MKTTSPFLRQLPTFVIMLAGTASLWPASAAGGGPLRVHPQNPRYFTDDSGKAIYLTGSHTWNNFKDMGPTDPPTPLAFDEYLTFLEQHGHNFFRLWTWELTKYAYDGKLTYAQPFPWPRSGSGNARDGKPKFDLAKLDAPYFERLRGRVETAGRRGMYVSVMLFEGHGLHASDVPWCWEGHPFHAANNANGIDGDPNGDGRGIEIQTLQVPATLAIQEAYVRKAVDTLNDLDNVLYEITNEAGAYSTEWQYHFIRLIHQYEKGLPKQHPVGMTFQYARNPQQRGTNAALFASPADWISPNPEGGYRDNPPATDGGKVVLSDTDHLWGIGGNTQWVWKSFCRGLNPIFMDPYTRVEITDAKGKKRTTWTDHLASPPQLDPKWEPVRKALGHTRRFAQRMNLVATRPENRLASSGYCLAHAAATEPEYLVYLPGGGEVTIDLAASPGELRAEWFDPATGRTLPSPPIAGGASRTVKAPFDGAAVLYLHCRPPYPPSPVIRSVRWAPADNITRKARGSDNWPLTWADDDWLYTAYGDGNGFEPFLDVKLGLGLAKVRGEPEHFQGINLRAPDVENRGQGAKGKKIDGGSAGWHTHAHRSSGRVP